MVTLVDLQNRIDAVRRKERGIIVTAGLLRTAAMFAIVVLVYFLADWIFDLTYSLRIISTLIGLGIVAYVVYRYLYLELAKIADDDEIALRVESRNPDLRGRLISTLQLTRAGKKGVYVGSSEMIAALEEETVRMSEPLDFFKIINRDMLVRVAIVSVLILVLKAAVVFQYPAYFAALGTRLIDANAKFPTKTIIRDVKVPPFVARGDDIVVKVLVDTKSYLPKAPLVPGFLNFKAGENTIPIELARAEDEKGDAVFTGTLAKALEDMELIATLGDATWQPLKIKVLSRPEVDVSGSGACIHYKYPAYAKTEVPDEKFGGLSALSGSTVEIRFKSTLPLVSAVMECVDGRKFEFKRTDDKGMIWALGEFPIDKSGSFHLSLLGSNSLQNSLPPVEYPIEARPDQPPVIKLLQPVRDVTVTPMTKLKVTFSARDDYGIRAVYLAYKLQSGEEGAPMPSASGDVKRIEVKLEKKREIPPYSFPFDLGVLGVKVGDQIIFWLEADDDCASLENRSARIRRRHAGTDPEAAPKNEKPEDLYSRTADVKLTVISREEKALELQAEIDRMAQQINEQKETEEELKGKVRGVIEKLKTPP